MKRMLLFAASLALSASLAFGLTSAMADGEVIFDDVTPAAHDVVVHQFGAVSYLDDSGFYGVGDAPDYTNPQPMPDDPATYLGSPGFEVAMLNCDAFRLLGGEPGGEGGGDGSGDPPADPNPSSDPPAPAPEGDPPQGFCL